MPQVGVATDAICSDLKVKEMAATMAEVAVKGGFDEHDFV